MESNISLNTARSCWIYLAQFWIRLGPLAPPQLLTNPITLTHTRPHSHTLTHTRTHTHTGQSMMKKKKPKKQKGNKGVAAPPPAEEKHMMIYVSRAYPAWRVEVLKHLSGVHDSVDEADGGARSLPKDIMKRVKAWVSSNDDLKAKTKLASPPAP